MAMSWIKEGELFLIGLRIQCLALWFPLTFAPKQTASKIADASFQIRRLIGKTEQKGYTLVPLNLQEFRQGRLKVEGQGQGAEHVTSANN